jgi:hypothetical protein
VNVCGRDVVVGVGGSACAVVGSTYLLSSTSKVSLDCSFQDGQACYRHIHGYIHTFYMVPEAYDQAEIVCRADFTLLHNPIIIFHIIDSQAI